MTETLPGALMSAEIREQPEAIERLLAAEGDRIWAMAERWRRRPPRFISIAARGTSDHVALYGKYLFEVFNGISVGMAAPSIATVYDAKVNVEGALFIGISQSGQAADVIAALEQARRGGADTLAVTNVPGSPICAAAQETILLNANPERAVAATKTYTTSLAALALLSAAIGRNDDLREQLRRVPDTLRAALREESDVRDRVARFRYLEECVVLGRGFNLGTALELALKLRETCNIRAQSFASPDFMHGPIAIVETGYPVIAIANRGPALSSVLDVVGKVRERGAEIVVIGNAPEAQKLADVPFPVNLDRDVPEAMSPFASVAVGQIIACDLAVMKGLDPDRPRGLNKVTVTR
jgi:glucosamine--fructose-6-phosphate aminotransferase (isomerizing)